MHPNALSPELRRLFGAAQLYSDNRTYAVVSLPRDQMRAATILFGGLAEPFAAMIVDKDEITIVIHEIDWSIGGRGLEHQRLERDFRLVTFDLALDLNTVGIMAVVGRLLAEAGISFLPVAAYSRDHILVRARHFDRAWRVLSDFTMACQTASE